MKRVVNSVLDHTFDVLPALLLIVLTYEPAHRIVIIVG